MAGRNPQRGRGLIETTRLDSHIRRENPQRYYDIVELIGSGSYGQVYTGHKKTDVITEVALKRMFVKDANELIHLQTEITLLYKLNHPNIVRYYDSFYHNKCLWLVMELCSYDSLQDIYNNKKNAFNEDQIAFVMREMFGAVSYIHSQHVMHRDIKGANILLTQQGDVKLADFGVSVETVGTMDRTKTLIGTPYWMAPEMASADNRNYTYSNKCDIWALGIVAIELAHGQPPNYNYEPKQFLAVLQTRRFKAPKLSGGAWSGDFHHFVKWTLSHNPMKRPTAEEVLHESEFLNKPNIGPRLMLVFLRKPPASENSEQGDDEGGPEGEGRGGGEGGGMGHRGDNDDKVIYSRKKADASSGHAIHAPQQMFNHLSQEWPNSSSESIPEEPETASAPVYENRGGQKRSEGALKQPVPPPNKPAPLAKSESMKESSGGLTSRYMGHPDSSQNNCSQLPFPLPSEREPSGTAASTTIKNAQQPSSNQNAAVYQNNSNSDGCGSNKDKMEILDYDHTLRAIGSHPQYNNQNQELSSHEMTTSATEGSESVPSKPPRSFSPSSRSSSDHVTAAPSSHSCPSAPQSSHGNQQAPPQLDPSRPNGYSFSASHSSDAENNAAAHKSENDSGAPVTSASADKQKQVSRKPEIPEVLMGAMFSKVFDSVSFSSYCAVTWVNPDTNTEYILFACDQGVYSLDVEQVYLSEPQLTQIYSSRTTWMQIHENQLISISGTRKTYVCQHDLAGLYTNNQTLRKQVVAKYISSRIGLAKTQKIQATRGCLKCCLTKTFNDTHFMCTQQVDRFILFQWYENKFKELHSIRLEDAFQRPLSIMTLLITDKTDYPYLCYDVEENPDNPNHYEVKVLNLDNITQTLGSTHKLEINSKRPPDRCVVSVRQLEKDTLLICFPTYIRITNLEGKLKSTRKRAVKLDFEGIRIRNIVVLDSSVLVFHDHGMVGKSFETTQVTQNICDMSQTYRLLDSSGLIVVESLSAGMGGLGSSVAGVGVPPIMGSAEQERKRHIHVVAGHKSTLVPASITD